MLKLHFTRKYTDGPRRKTFRSLKFGQAKNLCQYPLLLQERTFFFPLNSISLFSHSAAFVHQGPGELLLGLGAGGYVLGGASSEAFNEDSFYGSKRKIKINSQKLSS